VSDAPAPQRLAPHAAAVTGHVPAPDDHELASGRLVLLHDPAGVESWAGTFRLVAYVRGETEQEMAGDPFLPAVAWTWLLESLDRRGADQLALAGTVTRISSQSFGAISGRPPGNEVEIRASWTPHSADLGAHLAAWGDLLCATAGLPPLPPGVVTMQRRRRS